MGFAEDWHRIGELVQDRHKIGRLVMAWEICNGLADWSNIGVILVDWRWIGNGLAELV